MRGMKTAVGRMGMIMACLLGSAAGLPADHTNAPRRVRYDGFVTFHAPPRELTAAMNTNDPWQTSPLDRPAHKPLTPSGNAIANADWYYWSSLRAAARSEERKRERNWLLPDAKEKDQDKRGNDTSWRGQEDKDQAKQDENAEETSEDSLLGEENTKLGSTRQADTRRSTDGTSGNNMYMDNTFKPVSGERPSQKTRNRASGESAGEPAENRQDNRDNRQVPTQGAREIQVAPAMSLARPDRTQPDVDKPTMIEEALFGGKPPPLVTGKVLEQTLADISRPSVQAAPETADIGARDGSATKRTMDQSGSWNAGFATPFQPAAAGSLGGMQAPLVPADGGFSAYQPDRVSVGNLQPAAAELPAQPVSMQVHTSPLK